MKLVHIFWRLAALFAVLSMAACSSDPTYDCGNVTVTTLAGSGSAGSADNATGTLASFNEPRGIASDGTNLYVVDTGNHKIRKIVIATGAVSTLAGTGSAGSADNATGTLASFNGPRGIASDGTNLYVADTGNSKIRKIVIATGAVSTLAGTGSAGNADNTTGTLASFNGPRGIASDGTNLYVADYGNSEIRKIVISTGAVTTLAGPIIFWLPTDLVVKGTTLYVSTDYSDFIGTVSTVTGSTVALTTSGQLPTDPGSWATDGTNLYLTAKNNDGDSTQRRSLSLSSVGYYIYKIVPATGVATVLDINFGSYLRGIVTADSSPDGVNLYVTRGNEVLKVNYASVCSVDVGGTVVGLDDGKSVVLKNNSNSDTKIVSSKGVFWFNTKVASGQAYNVIVDAQPSGQTCTVSNGTGTVTGKVTDVQVNCISSSPSTYTIGVTASGLSGTVVLQDNSGDDLSITVDGNFTFVTPVTSGGAYNVTVLTQPAGQTCSVSNGSGTASANVTNVAVSCSASLHTISGIVNNLQFPTLVLQNNGSDDLSVPPGFPAGSSMPFTFATMITHGGAYNVTVLTQPMGGQTCTVTSGGSGTATGNVTDVVINCAP